MVKLKEINNLNIIIQALFNSSELKGKILKKLIIKEVLLIMTERLTKFRSNIIVNNLLVLIIIFLKR